METTQIIAAVVAVAGTAMVVGGVLLARAARTGIVSVYLGSLDGDQPEGESTDEFAKRLAEPFFQRVLHPLITRVGSTISIVAPSEHRVRIRTSLAKAGLDLRHRPEEIIAAQTLGILVGIATGVALLVSGRLSAVMGIAAIVVFTFIGAAAPMAWLSKKVDERRHAILTDLPDTLDLLAISVEAGVGLEGAMEVVTERFDSPLAHELGRTLQEMGLGLTRRDALSNLKQRSQVPELSSFVQALIQADLLGMPLGRVLKVQATEMRAKRRQWARERAAKLPVKILLPLVFCIFPAVLVVILGPAVSQIGQAL